MTKKRIILTSIISATSIATIAVGASLAWYGASNLLNVNYFDISIVGTTTLKLSTRTDLDSFREDISSRELKEEMQKDFLFEPVSSMCKNNWMDEEKDMPVFYDCSSPLTPSSGIPDIKIANSGFFSKKIYLLSSLDYYVSIDPAEDMTFFKNDSASNSIRAQALYDEMKKKDPNTTVTKDEIKESLENLKYCLRASILVNVEGNYQYYVIDPWKDENNKTRFGGLLDNDGNGYFDTYVDVSEGIANQKERETVYGEVNDRSLIVYDNPAGSEITNIPERKDSFYGNCFEGINKETAYTFNEQASLANGLRFAEEESISLKDLQENESLIKIPCYKDVPTEIVVSIYLEGWDHQCINGTMGASFDTKISFKLNGGII